MTFLSANTKNRPSRSEDGRNRFQGFVIGDGQRKPSGHIATAMAAPTIFRSPSEFPTMAAWSEYAIRQIRCCRLVVEGSGQATALSCCPVLFAYLLGSCTLENEIIQLVLKQVALEKLKEENDKVSKILVQDFKVSQDKFKVNIDTNMYYSCSDCFGMILY